MAPARVCVNTPLRVVEAEPDGAGLGPDAGEHLEDEAEDDRIRRVAWRRRGLRRLSVSGARRDTCERGRAAT